MPVDPKKMRQQVADLLARSAASADGAERKRFAAEAFQLAQLAEATERSLRENRQRPKDLNLEKNLRLVAENNLTRFLGCLCNETQKTQRELYRGLMLQEEQWFGMREERLEVLHRLIRDCDGRVQQHKALLDGQRMAGVDTTHAETLMTNMLETQALLRDSLQKELRHG